MSFGNELKAAREAQALSVQDVAGRIKVRGDYLRALEAEDLTVLPERTFARSYLQSYARALNLDVAPLLRDFDRLMPQPPEQVNNLKKPGRQLPPTRRRGASGLLGWMLGGVVLLGAAGYFVYSAYQSRSVPAASQESTAALPSTRQVRFSLSSTPSGARVYLDNRYLGLTPVRQFPLDARAQAALRVEYGGRQSYASNLSLEADRNLSVRLLPMTAAQLAAQRAAAQAAAVGTPATGTQTAGAQPAATQPPSATPAAGTQTPAAATTPAGGVRLSWTGASWTRVTSASGQVLYQGIPAAGSSRDFPKGVTVRTGSAGLVTATVGGGAPQRMGEVGAVVTRTF